MVDKEGMCVDCTRLYRTLRKTPMKREGKEPFLTKEEIRLRIKQGRRIHRKKLESPPKYDYRTGDYSIKEYFCHVTISLKRKNLTWRVMSE